MIANAIDRIETQFNQTLASFSKKNQSVTIAKKILAQGNKRLSQADADLLGEELSNLLEFRSGAEPQDNTFEVYVWAQNDDAYDRQLEA